jgi:hypothetical protein
LQRIGTGRLQAQQHGQSLKQRSFSQGILTNHTGKSGMEVEFELSKATKISDQKSTNHRRRLLKNE